MDRRRLGATLISVALCMLAFAATASAHKTRKTAAAAAETPGPCVVRSIPSFIDQGENHEVEVEVGDGFHEKRQIGRAHV